MQLSDLSYDVIDRILLNIPDFATLSAALHASKQLFYAVYQTRPNSILQSVARNVAAPAYKSAFKLLLRTDVIRFMSICQDECCFAEPPRPLTRRYICSLNDNASTVKKLEDLFSVKYIIFFMLIVYQFSARKQI